MQPSDLKGKKVTVIGGARSGLAVARLLAKSGARVFLTERGEATARLTEALDELGAAYEFGGHTPRALDADFFAVSPGVPSSANIVQQALRGGMPVYSEIEVASWFCRAPIVAITGSNGKTTTTSLTGHLFRTAGRSVIVGGNIGYPFSDYVADAGAEDVVVLEVSSFQLDHVDRFRPRVSVLLNITPDHLDRYDNDFEKYARSKFRIFENQREDDVLVYNVDDEVVRAAAEGAAARGLRVLGVSIRQELASGAFLRGTPEAADARLVLRLGGPEEELLPVDALSLRGQHNLYNALSAAASARVLGVGLDALRTGLHDFRGVPHRLEFVRELDGVRYVNDSKATNVNAVWYALESFREPIVLIAGGRDKGNDYESLKPLVRERVRGLVALGESAEKVLRELGGVAPATRAAGSMEEAIRLAREMARPGDVVLLSPACASFDLFQNYEDRGDTFKRLVNSL